MISFRRTLLPPPLSMAFNLSAIDVVDRAFVLSLIERINRLGIDPTRIEFEITETAVMNDFAAARDVLTALTQAGYSNAWNVAQGFEGDKDAQGHRGSIGGWKAAGLPWVQS